MTIDETKQKRIIRIKMKHVKSEYNLLKTEPLHVLSIQASFVPSGENRGGTGGKLSGGIHHKEGVEFTFHCAAR